MDYSDFQIIFWHLEKIDYVYTKSSELCECLLEIIRKSMYISGPACVRKLTQGKETQGKEFNVSEFIHSLLLI